MYLEGYFEVRKFYVGKDLTKFKNDETLIKCIPKPLIKLVCVLFHMAQSGKAINQYELKLVTLTDSSTLVHQHYLAHNNRTYTPYTHTYFMNGFS